MLVTLKERECCLQNKKSKSEKDFLFKSPKDKVMGVACTKALEIKRRGLKTKVILEVNSVVCAN